MSRYIDADALLSKYGEKHFNGEITSEEYYAIKIPLDYAPTADVVEVVRCKNCVYYENFLCCRFSAYGNSVEEPEYDYCSYGERGVR